MAQPKKQSSARKTGLRRSHLVLNLARRVNAKSPVKVRTTKNESGKKKAGDALSTGKALDKFREFVSGQGGNPDITRDHGLLPQAGSFLDVKAETGGYISRLDAMRIGLASQHTGAGRQRKDDKIDMSAGIVLKRKLGDIVSKGDVICTVYGNDRNRIEAGAKEAAGAFEITEEKPGSTFLIKKIIY